LDCDARVADALTEIRSVEPSAEPGLDAEQPLPERDRALDVRDRAADVVDSLEPGCARHPARDYCSAASTIEHVTATAALVERALARVAAADGDALARAAGRSFFDFATCVHGGRRALDSAWADLVGRLALEAHALAWVVL